MSEAKQREFDLDAVRTDGWFERIGEGIGSFQALCEIIGERFFAFSIIVGARNEEQLIQNLGAAGWNLTKEQVERLDEASEQPLAYPYWHQRKFFSGRNPLPV